MTRKPKERRLPTWRCGPLKTDLVEAEAAQRRMTPDYIRRGKRIQKAGATKILVEARQLFIRAMCKYGMDTARDVFQQVLTIEAGQAKQKNAHNPDRDRLLLATFDEKNPESPWSMAKRGDLPKLSRPMTHKTEFAAYLVKPPQGKIWGFKSHKQMLRRLGDLERARNTK